MTPATQTNLKAVYAWLSGAGIRANSALSPASEGGARIALRPADAKRVVDSFGAKPIPGAPDDYFVTFELNSLAPLVGKPIK